MKITGKILKAGWFLPVLTVLFLAFAALLYPKLQPCSDYGSYSVTASRRAPVPVTPEAPKPVDINTASAAQLETLSGIGPVLARRIIDYRALHGPFREIDELLEVEGIGDAVLERIRDHITVG